MAADSSPADHDGGHRWRRPCNHLVLPSFDWHSPWSSQDPHRCLLNLHVWQARVGKQCVYQMTWNQIPGQVCFSEARVSALTAPTSCPLPISAQHFIISVLGSFLRAEPSTAPPSFSCASDGHCDGSKDRCLWAPG